MIAMVFMRYYYVKRKPPVKVYTNDSYSRCEKPGICRFFATAESYFWI